MATYYDVVPDFLERKGSLFLRSDHMNYGRATLNSNWHQARESEPRDNDINKGTERNLTTSTYRRIGNVTDGSIPDTTYQSMCDEYNLKPNFTEKQVIHHMCDKKNILHEMDVLDSRETGRPKKGYGSVLPRHHPDHNKHHLETTHRADYKLHYPLKPGKPEEELIDFSLAYKKCHSQFSDTANHRRYGRNTWQDESGHYHNSHHKAECKTYEWNTPNPILQAFQQK